MKKNEDDDEPKNVSALGLIVATAIGIVVAGGLMFIGSIAIQYIDIMASKTAASLSGVEFTCHKFL